MTHERSVTMPILPRVLQAKIELSAAWLRAQTEGTVLLIGQQTLFGRWPD
jgi:hypothetical protein